MDATRTRPHTVEFVKAEIRSAQFFAVIGTDRNFQTPHNCDPPMVKAQQIYQAMRGCLIQLKNVSIDDEHWIKDHLEKLRQDVELPAVANY